MTLVVVLASLRQKASVSAIPPFTYPPPWKYIMTGIGPSAFGVYTRTLTAPAFVSTVLSSTPATLAGAPVMDGDHRARNEALTSSIGRRHCGAVVLASLSSINSLSAGCRVIVHGS